LLYLSNLWSNFINFLDDTRSFTIMFW
jgi:hypothetical protein